MAFYAKQSRNARTVQDLLDILAEVPPDAHVGASPHDDEYLEVVVYGDPSTGDVVQVSIHYSRGS